MRTSHRESDGFLSESFHNGDSAIGVCHRTNDNRSPSRWTARERNNRISHLRIVDKSSKKNRDWQAVGEIPDGRAVRQENPEERSAGLNGRSRPFNKEGRFKRRPSGHVRRTPYGDFSAASRPADAMRFGTVRLRSGRQRMTTGTTGCSSSASSGSARYFTFEKSIVRRSMQRIELSYIVR